MDKTLLNDPKVLGQMYDYLYHMKEYTGRHYAFGIITTYYDWRIVWLPDTDDFAKATEPSKYQRIHL